MQYLGGKSKIRKQIATFLESVRKSEQTYFEPFVGGAWVLQEMSGKRIASDGNKALIAMYKALQDGWVPPTFVSEEEWRKWRYTKEITSEPMQAFCRVGCGFGGDWMGGFIGNGERGTKAKCSVKASSNSLLKQLPKIKDVQFIYGLFHEHKPENMLVYCDPPYQGTTQYGVFSGFDHDLFWETMREWSKNNTVVVSEYNAPEDFKCVWEKETIMCMYDKEGKQQNRTEKLFMYNGI